MPEAPRRTRFARLFPGGDMIVLAAEWGFERARQELINRDDDDVELLEVEIAVIRTHGKPKLQIVREHSARCPCCGELVQIEVQAQQQGGSDAG